MEIDQSDESTKSAEALQKLISKGPLPSSLSKLSGSAKGVPFEKDFHFYNNFSGFKSPIKRTDENSNVFLKKVGAASELWGKGKETNFPDDSNDLELEPYDWLVNLNDDVMEKFDVSIDEFREMRKKEEESGVRMMKMGMDGDDGEGGFQMVYGKKKNRREAPLSSGGSGGLEVGGNVQVAMKVKPKVPFHIPSVPRPQDEYKIIVNNSNQPFEHVWLQRNEDGSRAIHPLEKFSPLDFVDKSVDSIEPVKPPALESTPFKFVEEVRDLKALAGKLRNVDEFAVDLEHNQYRSFQGLTCLMQISTRTEDFIVDTLKLRIHIGPYLREVFKDPTKKKVMHGSERDILWLQRDFGIYVCNMFDTGQASRVLKLERNSLEHLLHHFCGVTANKEYQNAEWRLRPLPHEMIRYAREDTHYLLYIYDLMRMRLLALTPESEQSDPPLVEVYKRSYDICMQLYEKELLTDDSYLHIYGVQGADLTAEQLAVVAGLCEWRDVVARAEDESTGYILPNKTLIEIAKQMPLTTSKLRWLVKSKHPYIERNLSSVLSIIRHSMQNAANFKAVVEQLKELKEQRMLKASEESSAMADGSEVLPPESSQILESTVIAGDISTSPKLASTGQGNTPLDTGYSLGGGGEKPQGVCSKSPGENESGKSETDDHIAAVSKQEMPVCGSSRENNSNITSPLRGGATVQVLKKPSRAFGALLGNSAKRKFQSDNKEAEQIKLEQIKSAVNLPFHAFVDKGEPAKPSEIPPLEEPLPATSSKSEDVIIIDSDDEPVNEESRAENDDIGQKEDSGAAASALEMDGGDENVSLSDLSSSFQNCFKSINETRNINSSGKSLEHPQLKPFDFEAAREQIKFGKAPRGDGDGEDGKNRRGKGQRKSGSSGVSLSLKEDDELLPQGKRRQAFPASGNRSATFR